MRYVVTVCTRCGAYVVMDFYSIPLDNTRAVLGDRRLSSEYLALGQDTRFVFLLPR